MRDETKPLYYPDYLQLDKILGSQNPKGFAVTNPAYDEMLFIIVHQAYELWFKAILFELDLVIAVLHHETIDDNSAEMVLAVHRLKRIAKVWQLLIDQVEILETMTSLDFLEFRDILQPASGFQSKQFRIIEAKFGLQMGQRSSPQHYKHTGQGGFSEDDYADIEAAEKGLTLKPLVVGWLERMPFFRPKYWRDYERRFPADSHKLPVFWSDYRKIYFESLKSGDAKHKEEFDKVFVDVGSGDLSPAAMRAALFIMLYRDLPIFRFPYELINELIELDELMAAWRHRHLLMVRRMIGLRMGTGGTAGAPYLEGTLGKHYVYRELTDVTTFVVPRTKLPKLPDSLRHTMSFNF